MEDINRNIASTAIAIGLILGLTACTHAPQKQNIDSTTDAESVTSGRLERFSSVREFETYREQVRRLGKKNRTWWSRVSKPDANTPLFAQNQAVPCDPTITNCGTALEETVVVTGSKVSKSNTSITNNQDAEVDEGDIVKQYGKFLIILQDGRLFSVDTSTPLKLIDRINLYESNKGEAWYDELLVFGNKLVVTGYSYAKEASEINVLTISDAGILSLEARYLLESNDYFSGNNYASRLVRGQLLIYMPVDMSEFRHGEPMRIPRIRKWTTASGFTDWKPLFEITDVYKPIQPTLTPQLHVIAICPVSLDAAFNCKSRAVVAPPGRELYVSGKNAYLWVMSDVEEWGYAGHYWDDCSERADIASYAPLRSAAYRFSHDGDGVLAVHTQGAPYDQFAFEERDGRLQALLVRMPQGCYPRTNTPMQFTAIPLNRFSTTPGRVPSQDYIRLPVVPRLDIQSRYTDTHVLYGSPEGPDQAYWEGDEPYKPGKVVAVPLTDPSHPITLRLPHSAERVESFGSNAVVFGYSPDFKMAVSTVSLRAYPKVADTKPLGDLVESEGRSHAFNYISDDDGSGTFGLPTIVSQRGRKSSYYYYNDEASDVQFFTADRALNITPRGFLGGIPATDKEDEYKCEVSCVDWYGNSRPIFIEGRIFALTGTELIEGKVLASGVVETGRLRITSPPAHTR